jgi:hypothetical protein
MNRLIPRSMRTFVIGLLLAPALVAGAGAWARSSAQSAPGPCDFNAPQPRFPSIPLCVFPGAYRDSSLISPRRCLGSFKGPLSDSVASRPRTVTIRFLRDRVAEARSDFGGYRIYRVINSPDSTRMVLIRRFSVQPGDERTWNFSRVDARDPATLPFKCNGQVVNDSVVTMIDPDSSGNYVRVCRNRIPPNDPNGACASPGDSVLILVAPPGPHDGFRTWYAITYELKNQTLDANYTDMFVPDTAGVIGPCTDPLDRNTCPNLNNKLHNLSSVEVEPTPGPTANLLRVGVVPNPFRGREAWDQTGAQELHFINLPSRARIRIYTAAGDLVADLRHDDTVRDFERWNLKNQDGRDVASGIYMFRVEAEVGGFTFQDRFIVIR